METKNVSKKLLAIQKEVKVLKNEKNEFAGFNYRTLESIFKEIKPLLEKQNCGLVMNDEIVLIGDRYYVKATATFTDLDSGEQINVSAFGREDIDRPKMCEAQVTGSTSSYARKYCLGGLFLLDDNKDIDSMDNTKNDKKMEVIKPKQNIPSNRDNKITKAQDEILTQIIKDKKIAPEKVLEVIQRNCKKEKISDLTDVEARKLIEYFSKYEEKNLQ